MRCDQDYGFKRAAARCPTMKLLCSCSSNDLDLGVKRVRAPECENALRDLLFPQVTFSVVLVQQTHAVRSFFFLKRCTVSRHITLAAAIK